MGNTTLLDRFVRDQERRNLRSATISARTVQYVCFLRWLDGRGLLDVTKADIETFLDSRPIGAKARATWLSNLHALYKFALSEELIEVDPTARISRPQLSRSLPHPIANNDLELALKNADATMRCWLLLGAYQGLRCQEIAGLSVNDVIEGTGMLRVVHGKGGHERMLPLHPEVVEALHALPLPLRGFVFTRPLTGNKWTPGAVSQKIRTYLRGEGIQSKAHELRHWFGCNLYQASHDLRLTQEMLGHASPTTTAIYTAFDAERAGPAVRGLSTSSKKRP